MNETLLARLKQRAEANLLVNKSLSAQLKGEINLPSFIRDWFLKDATDQDSASIMPQIRQRIKETMPNANTWPQFLDRLRSGETIKILSKVAIHVDLKEDLLSFSIDDFRLSANDTYIANDRWQIFKSNLLNTVGSVWGVLTLHYREVTIGKKTQWRICLEDFRYFAPFKVNVDHLAYIREGFTTEEWIDIILSSIDYQASGFPTMLSQLTFLQRLLPFVEPRLNLFELAPKGTGKSYIFSQVSNKVWWASGGVVSRAKFFYDMTLKTHGIVAHYDVLALDEISTLTFPNEAEMQRALKGYLETGRYTVGNSSGQSNCSFILLGNIPMEDMNPERNMTKTLPRIFQDSALLDRFHGLIEGWNIPRFNESLKMTGFALSTEFYAEMMHALRSESIYETLASSLIEIPAQADTRDTNAIKRLCAGFMKLLFPHWRSLPVINKEEFRDYCLLPSIRMRQLIKQQMSYLDVQFTHFQLEGYRVKDGK
jgi:ATP-dependent Lon protease